MYGFDARTGAEQWRQVLTPVQRVSPPVVIGETVFVLHAPTAEEVAVKTFDLESGERRWRFPMPWTDNLLPTRASSDSQLVVATKNGDLYGFSAA